MHKKSKHIETKIHFIWDKTEDWTISIHYVPTDKRHPTKFLGNFYPCRRWKHSELFSWEQILRNQLKSKSGCKNIDQTIVINLTCEK